MFSVGRPARARPSEFDRAGRAHHVTDRPQRVVLPAPLAPSRRRHAAFAEIEGEAMQRLDLAVIGAQVFTLSITVIGPWLPR